MVCSNVSFPVSGYRERSTESTRHCLFARCVRHPASRTIRASPPTRRPSEGGKPRSRVGEAPHDPHDDSLSIAAQAYPHCATKDVLRSEYLACRRRTERRLEFTYINVPRRSALLPAVRTLCLRIRTIYSEYPVQFTRGSIAVKLDVSAWVHFSISRGAETLCSDLFAAVAGSDKEVSCAFNERCRAANVTSRNKV